MNKHFLQKNWQVLTFNALIIIIFIVFYGHFGDITVDSFREAYIPEQILQGQVLYKNILTIYAPFSYLFNALLYLIFGVNLKVLYLTGLICTLCIFNLVFFIAKKFIPKTYALGIIIFCISTSVLSPNVFNFFFPYSYGMLYGLMFILGSVYCVLRKHNFCAFLLYSFAICCKYEFLLFLPVLIYVNGKKNLLKNLSGTLIPPLLILCPLILSGLTINDIITSVQIVLLMSSTKTLYWFYMVTGLVFQVKLIPIYFVNLFKTILPIFSLNFIKNKLFCCAIIIYSYCFINQEVLIFVFPLILLLFAVNYHRLNKQKKIFILSSLLISIKIFSALTIQSYGIYFLPFALISLFILIPHKWKKSLLITLLMFSITFTIKNVSELNSKSVLIKNQKGIVYTIPLYGNSINELIAYIKKNVSNKERVPVYPECLAVNFFTDTISDNKFYSLIPLYVETFGEDIVIDRLKLTQPKYIIISNYNTSQYYYEYFGQDYAGKILEYIFKYYNANETIGEGLTFTLFIKK